MRFGSMWIVSAFSLAAAALLGCSGYAAPNARMASAEAAIRGAQEVGAQTNPTAALYLRLAQEQVDKARNMMKEGDNKRADYLLMRAESDAELALAISRENSTRAQAQQVIDQSRSIRSGNNP